MGGSRRKLKRSRAKVQVGLPRKDPRVFKRAFTLPPKLRALVDGAESKWDDKGSVIENYKSFGVVSNPNLLGLRCRNSSRIVESDSLQLPTLPCGDEGDDGGEGGEIELDLMDDGSDLEEDDVKVALGKKRRDGKSAPLQPLTSIQRLHIGRLVEKYGDNYKAMFMDTKLNNMQHSVATLEKLCTRYNMYQDKNPMIVPS